jgi:hypothetical protein
VDQLTQDHVDLQRRLVHRGQPLWLRLRLRRRLDDRGNLGDRKSRLTPQIQQRNALPNFGGAEALGRQGEDEIPVGFIHPPVGPTDRVLASTETTSCVRSDRKRYHKGTEVWHRWCLFPCGAAASFTPT